MLTLRLSQVGWYDQSEDDASDVSDSNTPCIFLAITPAWSNRNLHRLADKVRSQLIFAHVRAATQAPLSEENCHPWSYGSLLWMHNGLIGGWSRKKRHLQALLSDEFYNFPQGSTDSEWSFAIFLDQLAKRADPRATHFEPNVLQGALLATIETINSVETADEPAEPSLLNFCVSDGRSIVASRYVSSRHQAAASLFFSTGSAFEADDSCGYRFRMSRDCKREAVVMIASEPLTFERTDWREVRNNSLIVVTPRNNVLQIPVVDRFQDSPTATRGDDYAASKGFKASRQTA